MMDEFTMTLNSPLTEEEFDMITDVDFERTDKVWFHTKHGKKVEFAKQKKGRWINHRSDEGHNIADCSDCGATIQWFDGDDMPNFCCMCGSDMRKEGGA